MFTNKIYYGIRLMKHYMFKRSRYYESSTFFFIYSVLIYIIHSYSIIPYEQLFIITAFNVIAKNRSFSIKTIQYNTFVLFDVLSYENDNEMFANRNIIVT